MKSFMPHFMSKTIATKVIEKSKVKNFSTIKNQISHAICFVYFSKFYNPKV